MSSDLQLSAYELERLENIRRNEALLESLGLGQRSDPLIPATAVAPRKAKRPPPPPREPSRKSARVAALPAPAIYVEAELANGQLHLGGEGAAAVVKAAERRASPQVEDQQPDDDDDAPESEDALHPNEREAYAMLRAEKNSIAREHDVPAYHIAQNRALMSMVRLVPRTPSDLLQCWGWGEAKVAAYGERLLKVLESAAEELHVAKLARKSSKSARVTDSVTDDEVLSAAEEEKEEEEEEEAVYAGKLRLPESPDDLLRHETAAFEALLAWKRARARELGFNDPCVICHNRTLCELVRLLPSSLASLQRVWGIGAKRAMQHGQQMLDALEPFRAALAAKQGRLSKTPLPRPTRRGSSSSSSSSSTQRQRRRAWRRCVRTMGGIGETRRARGSRQSTGRRSASPTACPRVTGPVADSAVLA